MELVGYALVSIAVLYLGAILWLLGHARRRTALLRHTAWMLFSTALYALSSGIVYLRAARGLDYDWYYRACWVGWMCMGPVLQVSYEVRGKPRVARVVGAVVSAVWAGLVLLCLTTDLIETGAESLYPFVDRAGPLEAPARLLGSATLLFGAYSLFRARQHSRGLERQRVAYVLLGLSLYAVMGALTAGLLQVVGGVAWDPALTVSFSLPFLGLTLYAASRHRLFDVRLVVSHLVAGGLLIATATCCLLGLYWLLAGGVGNDVAVALAALVTALLFVATPLARLLSAAVARYVGPKRRLRSDADAWSLASLLDMGQLLERIVHSASESIDTVSAGLMLRRPDGDYAFACARGLSEEVVAGRLAGKSGIVEWTRAHAEPFVREELDAREHGGIDRELEPLGVEVVVPIVLQQDTIALLLLGPKSDRDAYLQGDLEVLRALASHAALAIQNARLYQRLNEVVVDLDGFVRAAAHDLRSPLRAIDQLAQFAAEDLGEDPAAVPGHISVLRQRARRMEALLDSVDAYVRAGRGDEEPEQVDVAEIVARLAARLDREGAFGIRCEGTMPELETAALCLEQVLHELLDNAIRHHDRATGHVTVSARSTPAFVEITVADDGPGIAPQYHGEVFRLFRTLKRRDEVEGSGMGLAVTRKLVERAGGSIAIASEGRGTAVSFTWPRTWHSRFVDDAGAGHSR